MKQDKAKDGVMEVVGVMLMIFAMISFLIWYVASSRIVFYGAPVLSSIGQLWGLLPQGSTRAAQIVQVGLQFQADSGHVSFADWMSYASICLKPLMILLAGSLIFFLLITLSKPRDSVRRRFSKRPSSYLEGMSYVFTGITPILHLRKQLVAHKDPLWRRQTFPEEVIQSARVNKKPLVENGLFLMDRAQQYFSGLHSPLKQGQRPHSKMLGHLVVDLVGDHGKPVVYPDRFSDVGKVIFALLCAYAYGSKEDYELARDHLNHSTRGAQSGMANLKQGQWLFDKMRKNAQAHELFAVHHWEYTYLYALFIEAKRNGTVTHAEFVWLKPMNRILFYVLNTVGRKTPHTESGGAFAQFDFERAAAKANRLPLQKNEQGQLVPSVMTLTAAEGLSLEFDRLQDSVPDEEDWWKNKNIWSRINRELGTQPIHIAAPLIDTPFDESMRADQKKADDQQNEHLAHELQSLFK